MSAYNVCIYFCIWEHTDGIMFDYLSSSQCSCFTNQSSNRLSHVQSWQFDRNPMTNSHRWGFIAWWSYVLFYSHFLLLYISSTTLPFHQFWFDCGVLLTCVSLTTDWGAIFINAVLIWLPLEPLEIKDILTNFKLPWFVGSVKINLR